MPKTFDIRAGERVRVLWLFSDSLPGQPTFTAEATGGGPLTGTIEVHRRRWFDWQEQDHPLEPRNVFQKGFADSDYRIYVTPDQDCRITFETRHVRAEAFFFVLLAVILLGLVSGLTAFMLAPA